jgi:hypothetical protein
LLLHHFVQGQELRALQPLAVVDEAEVRGISGGQGGVDLGGVLLLGDVGDLEVDVGVLLLEGLLQDRQVVLIYFIGPELQGDRALGLLPTAAAAASAAGCRHNREDGDQYQVTVAEPCEPPLAPMPSG